MNGWVEQSACLAAADTSVVMPAVSFGYWMSFSETL